MDRTNDRQPRPATKAATKAAPKAAAKARGPYAVGDERRRRILDVAVEHFAQWGFHASSLARIAKEVGVTQGGLLHHFRSKEDLLVSVLERSEEHDIEQSFAEDFDSAADCFLRLIDLVAYNSRRPGRTRMFNVLIGEASDPGHPAHAFFKRRYATVTTRLTDTFEAAVASGELHPDTDCTAVVHELIAVMDGHQLQWALAPDEVDMAARLRLYFDRLYRSISREGASLP
ncbi:TetR/AcrR family transcriptional regulator [Streptomyces sp. TRM66268-LWL]|uniref:TetR/AcrR family transcriptional regulator n=1 Tax=Streptomyces polyasparticus TaxID=2767826 RepID=A0ABR7S8A6_9ACTN|nr:TetR/AcrR family transcriptional regulator [Streptomyces polyasparticus]MBC9711010.1 TetR/AcrR family transcriptional regulator [Streptomyces polyasparticus]